MEAVDRHPDDDVAGDVGAVEKGDAFGWSFALDARRDLIRLVYLPLDFSEHRTYSRMETKGLVDYTIEVRNVLYICNIELVLAVGRGIDHFA